MLILGRGSGFSLDEMVSPIIIFSIPAMAIIMYELTLLGAILFTVGGIIFESRLPKLFMGAYDPRITEGFIGVVVNTTEDNLDNAQDVFKSSGAEDIKFP